MRSRHSLLAGSASLRFRAVVVGYSASRRATANAALVSDQTWLNSCVAVRHCSSRALVSQHATGASVAPHTPYSVVEATDLDNVEAEFEAKLQGRKQAYEEQFVTYFADDEETTLSTPDRAADITADADSSTLSLAQAAVSAKEPESASRRHVSQDAMKRELRDLDRPTKCFTVVTTDGRLRTVLVGLGPQKNDAERSSSLADSAGSSTSTSSALDPHRILSTASSTSADCQATIMAAVAASLRTQQRHDVPSASSTSSASVLSSAPPVASVSPRPSAFGFDSCGVNDAVEEDPAVGNAARASFLAPAGNPTTSASHPTAPFATASSRPPVDLRRLSHDEVTSIRRTRQYLAANKLAADLGANETRRTSTVDAFEGRLMEPRIRENLLQFYKRFPTNLMITVEKIIVAGVRAEDGTQVSFPNEDRQVLNLSDALSLARAHNRDLVQMSTLGDTPSEERAVCYLEDAGAMLQDFLEYHLKAEDIFALRVRQCYEVGFMGATKLHEMQFKCVFIAKYLAQQHPVRVSLRRFGTAVEGVEVFETLLGLIRKECARFPGRHHTASRVKIDYDEIACYLHPATPQAPLSETVHPSARELAQLRDHRLYEAQREIAVDNWDDVERLAAPDYKRMVEQGTAWTFRDEGQSLRKQRRNKIYQGWIPKGNKALYEARGDVELDHPFRTSSKTGVESATYPRESNLEQARRGAAVLVKRAHMDVSDMHDQNELEGEPSVLQRYHYSFEGDAIAIGNTKKEMGLKRDRYNKPPRFASGFATQGVAEDKGAPAGHE